MRQPAALLAAALFVQADGPVRSLDPVLRLALDQAVERSSTVRQQVDRLRAAGVLVYLQPGACADPDTLACTTIAPGTGPVRLLRITFALTNSHGVTILRQRRDRLLAQIGHELQHAIEVAESPDVVDTVSLQRLYARIGYRSAFSPHGFETAAAVDAGAAVLREVRQR
jgi:hypothetical protein